MDLPSTMKDNILGPKFATQGAESGAVLSIVQRSFYGHKQQVDALLQELIALPALTTNANAPILLHLILWKLPHIHVLIVILLKRILVKAKTKIFVTATYISH